MTKVSRRTLARTIADKLSRDNADGKAVMREVAAYLVAHNMTEDADVLINDIAQELFHKTGRLVVEVTSAHPLTDVARKQLVDHFSRETGARSVELHEMVDENLIGGLVAKTPSAELDVSVRNTLRQLTALA
jgi:F-type H+-transporting ATPase subunit delta